TTPITGAISSRWEPCSPDEKTGAGQWPEPVSPRTVPDGPGIRTRASRMQRQSGLAGACRLLRCTHLRQFLALFGREHGADLRTGLRTQQGHLCLRLAQRVGSLPGLGLVEGVGTAQFAQRFVRGTQRLSLVIEGLRLVVTDLEDLVLLFLAEIQGAQAMAAEMTVMAGVAAGVVPAHVMLAGTAIGRHAGRGRGGQG